MRIYPNSAYVPDALTLKALAHAHRGESGQSKEALARLRELDPAAAERLSRRLERVDGAG